MPSAPNMPQLNVPTMHKPYLDNFDAHVHNFIHFLGHLVDCVLIYEGPQDIRQHIYNRTVYACSVQHVPTGKILRNVFPVMIGTHLDLAIRHLGTRTFESVPAVQHPPFQELDIGRGFFIINGALQQLPYFFTNDPTRTHVVQNKFVRVFTYDEYDRGKELSYYMCDHQSKKRGELTAKSNQGHESQELVHHFFDHCPYPIYPAAYMAHMYRYDTFDIDSLSNKMIISPGHLFIKLFIKFLYAPLRAKQWSVVKCKTALIVKSIETGNLLPALSRKTSFFHEKQSAGKMTKMHHESHREIGANGEVFMEKNIGCYREISSQTYPLNPYLLSLIVRQLSVKVKTDTVPSFHTSYIGFLCILGFFDTKHVGRTMMMVRDTVVSTCNTLDPVFQNAKGSDFWSWLRLEPQTDFPQYFVVVNEACIPVTPKCFQSIDLIKVKRKFRFIECFRQACFIVINYKIGLLFKQIPGKDIWVTPRDISFWAEKLFHIRTTEKLVSRFGYDFMTSYIVDLNPFFRHNAFPKNILAFNALKNAVLASDSRYAHFFMDTVSAYLRTITPHHQNVLEPVEDGISPYFVLRMPQVTVSYMSFLGCTQEDSIVCRKGMNAFDCCRFFSVRAKIEMDEEGCVVFHPGQDGTLLGTVVYHGQSAFKLDPCSMHLKLVSIKNNIVQLHFHKAPFRIISHHISKTMLNISLEKDHFTSTGDKLCSLHGQKGVMRLMDAVPLLDEHILPDLIVNPYCLFRMTPGQILESIYRGMGKDACSVRNSDGQLIPHAKAFYGKTFYAPIAYWSSEHLYAALKCTLDKVLHQAVRGRSRGGGMKLGYMEFFNGLRGNGIASCFEEKFFEHGDRLVIPKSVELVKEDAKFFKCHLKYEQTLNVSLKET